MSVVVSGTHAEVEALVERRRRLGLDGRDEVWKGVYHVAPHAHSRHGKVESRLTILLHPFAAAAGLEVVGAFNLGLDERDYRVPDLGVREPGPDSVYVATARIVIEILSPDDETFEKFDFYAERGVDEILVADPDTRTIRCWALGQIGRYVERADSAVLAVECRTLRDALAWP
jgi:hypothetical protein